MTGLRDKADYRHALAVCCPVRVLHIVQDFTGGSAVLGNSGECPHPRIAAAKNCIKPDRQFSRLRDRKQFGILQPQFA